MNTIKTYFTNAFNADMNKFGPVVIGVVVSGVVVHNLTKDSTLENKVNELMKEGNASKTREHNRLLHTVDDPIFGKLDAKWETKLNMISKSIQLSSSSVPMTIFERYVCGDDMKNLNRASDHTDLVEAEKLLNYYLKYPCTDVIELNYCDEGYAVLGDDLSSLDMVNKLLCYVVGRKGSDNSRKSHLSITSHLTNYKSMCYYLERNRNNSLNSDNIPDHNSKILKMSDLYYMCTSTVGSGSGSSLCTKFK